MRTIHHQFRATFDRMLLVQPNTRMFFFTAQIEHPDRVQTRVLLSMVKEERR